jgi:hypothetical protein
MILNIKYKMDPERPTVHEQVSGMHEQFNKYKRLKQNTNAI